MRSRLPTTSYGYAPPRGARANGWSCSRRCTGGDGLPRRWPHPCPECGTAVDPVFEEPWKHEAEGAQLRHDVRFESELELRAYFEARLPVWEYEDARRRGDPLATDAARLAFRDAAADIRRRGHDTAVVMAQHRLALAMAAAGDLDGLAADILSWHPRVETIDVENDSDQRGAARTFVDLCTIFLLTPESIDHPHKLAVENARRDVALRISNDLGASQMDDLRRIQQLHGGVTEMRRLTGVSRSAGAVACGLVPVRPRSRNRLAGWAQPVSPGHLLTAFRLGQVGSMIARARAGKAPEQLAGALDELVTVIIEHGSDGPLVVEVAGAVADAAFVLAETQNDAASLTAAANRLTGLPSLAHLLRSYAHLATHADGDLGPAIGELQQVLAARDLLAPLLRPDVTAMLAWLGVCRAPGAVEAAVGQCESAQAMLNGRPGASDVVLARLLLWRSLLPGAHRDEQLSDLRRAIRLAGRHCGRGRSGRWQAETIRTNARHALEAVSGTGSLSKQASRWYKAGKAAARSSTADQARVALACVTWAVGTNEPYFAADAYDYLMSIVPLDAAVRYGSQARDLVLAQAQEHTEEAGFWLCRAGRYRDAVVALETGRAVTLGLAGTGEGAGREPVAVSYDDITAATTDGVIVYLAAAKAGGYALVVGCSFDPAYLELPQLDRASVGGLREQCLPSAGHSRDADVDIEGGPPARGDLDQALRTLWDNGIRELVLQYAGARLLTMIPIGQLSLLPLHAAGDPGPVTDEMSAWRHAGNFSAIRYAPNARTLRRCRATAAALDDDALTMLAADVPEGYGGPPRLPHVALETALAAAAWQGRAQVERDCTWERFQKVAPEHGVWHLACHATGSPFAAEESALVFEDAEVTLDEVRRTLDQAPRRLVVLSACQTNTTGVALPNEVVGFPSTLLQLGFAGAIATAWSVDDQACAFLMARFHRLWRRDGLHPAIALSRAQRWLRGATRAELAEMAPEIVVPGDDPYPFAHPLYWAAFAYTGA